MHKIHKQAFKYAVKSRNPADIILACFLLSSIINYFLKILDKRRLSDYTSTVKGIERHVYESKKMLDKGIAFH